MKNYIIALSMMICLFVFNNIVQAYTWNIKNLAEKTLLIQVELLGSSNPYFVLTQPGATAHFEWLVGSGKELHHLNGINYVVVDDALLNNKELIKDKSSVIDNTKIQNWLKDRKDAYPIKSAQLILAGGTWARKSYGGSANIELKFVTNEKTKQGRMDAQIVQ